MTSRLHRRRLPSWSIEVARSSRAYDLNQKKADYERAGVREYVVVELDPDRDPLVHPPRRRSSRSYGPGPDGIYRSEVFPGLWLDRRCALCRRPGPRRCEVLEQGLATPEHAAFAAKLASGRRGQETAMSTFAPLLTPSRSSRPALLPAASFARGSWRRRRGRPAFEVVSRRRRRRALRRL